MIPAILHTYAVNIVRMTYTIDGQMLELNTERFEYCEALFRPSILLSSSTKQQQMQQQMQLQFTVHSSGTGTDHKSTVAINDKDNNGIHHLCVRAVQQCHSDLHRDLYANIVLAGGTTMLQGTHHYSYQ
jgi:actin-related protein